MYLILPSVVAQLQHEFTENVNTKTNHANTIELITCANKIKEYT